jgi:DNA polymerase bacteriophage-type
MNSRNACSVPQPTSPSSSRAPNSYTAAVRLDLDIETRSAVDLKTCGVYVYAESDTTQVTHCAWAVDGAPVEVWLPLFPAEFRHIGRTILGVPVLMYGGPMPAALRAALADPECEIIAHNAGFERTVLRGRLSFPVLPVRRFQCTAARAAGLGLPRSLDGALAALGTRVTKDKVGHALMMKMCRPIKYKPGQTGPMWFGGVAEHVREAEYCAHDVYGERALLEALPAMSPFERDVWILTEEMNDRGIAVDIDLLDKIADLIADATRHVNAELSTKTGFMVERVSDHGAITRWLQSVDADDTGLGEDGIGKAALAAMIERTDLDDVVRSVLLLRRDGLGSASKYKAIRKRLSRDGRLRGSMVYCGASATRRFSSRGAQLHNMRRPTILKKSSMALAAIRDIQDGASIAAITELHGPPLLIAAELIRPTFIGSPILARGDSKQIEARFLPWLAGAERILDAFRAYDAGTGPDLYKVSAGDVNGVDPSTIGDEDPRRQHGKVVVLACGYQGGTPALQAMARGYGVKIKHAEPPPGVKPWDWNPPDNTDAWLVKRWRAANPEMADPETGLWALLHKAATNCMESAPGAEFHVGQRGLRFKRSGAAMALRLPSGGNLMFWSPRLSMRMMPWGKQSLSVIYRSEDTQTHQWREDAGYGGLYTAMATQGGARDLMAHWLLLFAAAGLFPVLTVHDEGIGETNRDPVEAAAIADRIMRTLPDWAAGLPVNVDASAGPRYLK